MDYPAFRARGFCVSSGVVKAGCKRIVGARLKRGGMYWTLAGANAIIALRSYKLSGRFEAFFERRCQRMGFRGMIRSCPLQSLFLKIVVHPISFQKNKSHQMPEA